MRCQTFLRWRCWLAGWGLVWSVPPESPDRGSEKPAGDVVDVVDCRVVPGALELAGGQGAQFGGEMPGRVPAAGRAFGQHLELGVPDGQQAGAEPVLPGPQHGGDLADALEPVAWQPAHGREGIGGAVSDGQADPRRRHVTERLADLPRAERPGATGGQAGEAGEERRDHPGMLAVPPSVLARVVARELGQVVPVAAQDGGHVDPAGRGRVRRILKVIVVPVRAVVPGAARIAVQRPRDEGDQPGPGTRPGQFIPDVSGVRHRRDRDPGHGRRRAIPGTMHVRPAPSGNCTDPTRTAPSPGSSATDHASFTPDPSRQPLSASHTQPGHQPTRTGRTSPEGP